MMKYIITKQREVIIFQPSIEHKCMADKFNGALSAGFVKIVNQQVLIPKVESISLGIGPDIKKDTYLIKNNLIKN